MDSGCNGHDNTLRRLYVTKGEQQKREYELEVGHLVLDSVAVEDQARLATLCRNDPEFAEFVFEVVRAVREAK